MCKHGRGRSEEKREGPVSTGGRIGTEQQLTLCPRLRHQEPCRRLNPLTRVRGHMNVSGKCPARRHTGSGRGAPYREKRNKLLARGGAVSVRPAPRRSEHSRRHS